MGKKPKFSFREDQHDKIDEFKAKGYAVVDKQHNGTVLALVDSEGFRQKVVVSIHGKSRRYKPRKAKTREYQRLPVLTKGTARARV